jgi:hypothetical protein
LLTGGNIGSGVRTTGADNNPPPAPPRWLDADDDRDAGNRDDVDVCVAAALAVASVGDTSPAWWVSSHAADNIVLLSSFPPPPARDCETMLLALAKSSSSLLFL